LREKERKLDEARERLRSLRAHRDTLASPYVARRLQALEQALTRKPLNVVEANKALKEAVSRIVINPETEVTLHWHHAPDQPTDAGNNHGCIRPASSQRSPMPTYATPSRYEHDDGTAPARRNTCVAPASASAGSSLTVTTSIRCCGCRPASSTNRALRPACCSSIADLPPRRGLLRLPH
jgi:hypothetical protein